MSVLQDWVLIEVRASSEKKRGEVAGEHISNAREIKGEKNFRPASDDHTLEAKTSFILHHKLFQHILFVLNYLDAYLPAIV